jgi:hypothetical protein
MAEQFWRLRRARVLETSLLDSDQVLIPHLAAIQRMMSSAERGFHKALSVLRQLQEDRGFVPANSHPAEQAEPQPSRDCQAAVGFVSQCDQNPDCQERVKPPAEGCELIAGGGFVPQKQESGSVPANSISEPRPKEAVAAGFVPPPCPQDEDIDPADWARAFEARHRVHVKVSSQRVK